MNIQIQIVLLLTFVLCIQETEAEWDEKSECATTEILKMIEMGFKAKNSFTSNCSLQTELGQLFGAGTNSEVTAKFQCDDKEWPSLKNVDFEIKFTNVNMIDENDGDVAGTQQKPTGTNDSKSTRILAELKVDKKFQGSMEFYFKDEATIQENEKSSLIQLYFDPLKIYDGEPQIKSGTVFGPINDFVGDSVMVFIAMIDSFINDIDDFKKDMNDVFGETPELAKTSTDEAGNPATNNITDPALSGSVNTTPADSNNPTKALKEFMVHFQIKSTEIESSDERVKGQYEKREKYFSKLFHYPSPSAFNYHNMAIPILRYTIEPKPSSNSESPKVSETLTKIFTEVGPADILIMYHPVPQVFAIVLRTNFYQAESVIISVSRALVMQQVVSMIIQYGIEMYKLLGSMYNTATQFVYYESLNYYIKYLFKDFDHTPSVDGAKDSFILTGDTKITIEVDHRLDTVFFTSTFLFNEKAQMLFGHTEASMVFMRAFPASSQYFMAPLIQIYFFELFNNLGFPDLAAAIDLTYFRRDDSYKSEERPEGDALNFRHIGTNFYFDLSPQIKFCENDGNARKKLVYIPLEIPDFKRFVFRSYKAVFTQITTTVYNNGVITQKTSTEKKTERKTSLATEDNTAQLTHNTQLSTVPGREVLKAGQIKPLTGLEDLEDSMQNQNDGEIEQKEVEVNNRVLKSSEQNNTEVLSLQKGISLTPKLTESPTKTSQLATPLLRTPIALDLSKQIERILSSSSEAFLPKTRKPRLLLLLDENKQHRSPSRIQAEPIEKIQGKEFALI
jgi:hypothetical protein